MRIVIIEDEPLTAKDLAACILAAEPGAEIVASLASVGEAKAWFDRNAAPDLIFSDIQLGDGRAFAIFEELTRVVPVVFCTAYDHYALEAFGAAGIDYLLKPFTEKSVGAAIRKYRALRGAPAAEAGGTEGLTAAGGTEGLTAAGGTAVSATGKTAAGAILVYYKEKILPVRLGDIALFFLEKEVVRLVGFDGRTFLVNKSLEELEGLAGAGFFRVNRQYLVSRKVIRDVSQYFGRKLLVNLTISLESAITVGRVKVPAFLEWLAAG
jgi:DNA-binding LytR/AlgR family response regulator